jgi:hypothetical protein
MTNAQPVHLPEHVADELAEWPNADERYAVLAAAAEGRLTDEMTLEEALRTIHKVAEGLPRQCGTTRLTMG